MTFWPEVLAIFLGDIFASVLLVLLYAMVQWFLRVTDVTVSYNWGFEGTDFHPNLVIRNRSGSKSYLLANIAYRRNEGKEIVHFDNRSLWGRKLEPGSMSFPEKVAPVPRVTSMAECLNVGVTVYLQDGRRFWLKGQGPGQLDMGRSQRFAFWLREKFEKAAIPLE
jgi:hypothetical protein